MNNTPYQPPYTITPEILNRGAAVSEAVTRPSYTSGKEPSRPATTQETTQEKILACIRAEPAITGKQMALKIGITEDGIKYHLAKLKKAGIIRHLGPTRSGHREVLG